MKIFKLKCFFIILLIGGCLNKSKTQEHKLPKIKDVKQDFTSLEKAQQHPQNVNRFFLLNKPKLKNFPKEVFEFENMAFLEIHGTGISSIPIGIKKLKKLKTFIMIHSELKEIPNQVLQNNLTNLILHHNNIKSLFEDFNKSGKLQELDLSANSLKTLPENIGDLRNLVYLKLSENNLTKLPNGLIKLKKLKVLHLEGNNLLETPKNLDKLSNLEILMLGGNPNLQLTGNFFEEIKNLKKLSDIYLPKNVSKEKLDELKKNKPELKFY